MVSHLVLVLVFVLLSKHLSEKAAVGVVATGGKSSIGGAGEAVEQDLEVLEEPASVCYRGGGPEGQYYK